MHEASTVGDLASAPDAFPAAHQERTRLERGSVLALPD